MLTVPKRDNQQDSPMILNRMNLWGILFSVWLCLAAGGCSPDGAANISGRNLQDSLYKMDTLAARVLLEAHFETENQQSTIDSTALKDSLENAKRKTTKPPSQSGYSQPIITNNSSRSTPKPKKDTLQPPSLPVSIPSLDLQEPQPEPERTDNEAITPPPSVEGQAPEIEQNRSKDPAPVVPTDTIGGN